MTHHPRPRRDLAHLGTDLKALAYELLREAQQQLQDEDHLTPTAVVITPRENMILEIEYADEDEREEIYAELTDVAREHNALAVIAVNDVYLDNVGPLVTLQASADDELSQSAREAIMITVSGGGFETWSLISPYIHRGEQIIFHPAQEKRDPGAEVELLGDWTGRSGAA
ncbi:MAG TPA: hypothetical protein VI636_21245 [Candidatus Angelobacter sp.]